MEHGKLIRVYEDSYQKLKREAKKDESFASVIDKLLSEIEDIRSKNRNLQADFKVGAPSQLVDNQNNGRMNLPSGDNNG